MSSHCAYAGYVYPLYRVFMICLDLQISSSFANMDPFGTGQTLPPLQLPQSTSANSTVTPLKKPPKWICRPVGASFAVSFILVHHRAEYFVYLLVIICASLVYMYSL